MLLTPTKKVPQTFSVKANANSIGYNHITFTPTSGTLSRTLEDVKVVLFGRFRSGWRINKPLTVDVEAEDGLFVASDSVFYVYGSGASEHAALQDYVSSLEEFYRLVESRVATNPNNDRLFQKLRIYLQPPVHP